MNNEITGRIWIMRGVTLDAGDLYSSEKSMCDEYTMNENLPGRNG